MAKPKVKHLVQVKHDKHIFIYTDENQETLSEIQSIEGIKFVVSGPTIPILLTIDPRYSAEEIAQEIRDILADEVPSVFKEW